MNWVRILRGLTQTLIITVVLSACSAQVVPSLNLTILYTNNVEGELDPCSCLSDPAGGAARRSTAVRMLREKNPDLFLVDAGDALFGTPVADYSQGFAMVSAMNAMGYDVAVLGEEEFGFGLETLQRIIAAAEYPYLSANIVSVENEQPFTRASVVLERNGHRVAFLGLTTADVDAVIQADVSMNGKLKVLDPLQTARNLVPQLRKQADAVIVLSHLGSELDEELIKKVPGIAAVIGGHSREELSVVDARKIPIVQMGYQGDRLGILKIGVRSRGETVTAQSDTIHLNHEVETDDVMKSLLLPYKAQAALTGVVDLSEGMSSLLPLEVHRADKDTQRAYLGAVAFPDLYKNQELPGSAGDESTTLLNCFISGPEKGGEIEFSLQAVQNAQCIQRARLVLEYLPEPVFPTGVDNSNICRP